MADTFRLEGNQIIERAPGVWTLDGSVKFNFVPPKIARFPCRMSVLKLDGGLLVYSPLPPEHCLAEVQALGKVRWVVAPNSLHWLFAGKFAQAIRDSGQEVMLLAAPGLETKPEAVASGVIWDAFLPRDAPREWDGVVDCVHIKGIPLVEEVVLIHKPTKTLFGAELAFNLQKGDPKLDVTWPMNWYFDAMEGYRPCCVTRTFKYLSDAPTVKASVEEVLTKDFERYVPAHGAIIEHGAPEALRAGTLDLFTEFCKPCAPASPKRGMQRSFAILAAAVAAIGLAMIANGRSQIGVHK